MLDGQKGIYIAGGLFLAAIAVLWLWWTDAPPMEPHFWRCQSTGKVFVASHTKGDYKVKCPDSQETTDIQVIYGKHKKTGETIALYEMRKDPKGKPPQQIRPAGSTQWTGMPVTFEVKGEKSTLAEFEIVRPSDGWRPSP